MRYCGLLLVLLLLMGSCQRALPIGLRCTGPADCGQELSCLGGYCGLKKEATQETASEERPTPDEVTVEPPPELSGENPPEPRPDARPEGGPEPSPDARPEPTKEPTKEPDKEPSQDASEPVSTDSMEPPGEFVSDEPAPELTKETAPDTPLCTPGVREGCYPHRTGCTKVSGGYRCEGECKSGVRVCNKKGQWDTCSHVPPKPEECNDKDDDCDGVVDAVYCTYILRGRASKALEYMSIMYSRSPRELFFTTQEIQSKKGSASKLQFQSVDQLRQYGYTFKPGTTGRFAPLGLVARGFVYFSNSAEHTINEFDGGPQSAKIYLGAANKPGFVNGPAGTARFRKPHDLLQLPNQGPLLISDEGNHAIRQVEVLTTAAQCGAVNKHTGVCVTTFAGNGTSGYKDGPAKSARFSSPSGLAVDARGENIYVADYNNHKIRKITFVIGKKCGSVDPHTGYCVTTLAGSTKGFKDGPGTSAQFNGPFKLALDKSGNVYVTDSLNFRVRRIDAKTNEVTTIAGGGTQSLVSIPIKHTIPGPSILFGEMISGKKVGYAPKGIAYDGDKHALYIGARGYVYFLKLK